MLKGKLWSQINLGLIDCLGDKKTYKTQWVWSHTVVLYGDSGTDTRHALFVTRLFPCIMVATEISILCVYRHNLSSSVNIIHRHVSFFISYRCSFSCLSLFFIVRTVYWCMAAIYKHIMRPFFSSFFLFFFFFYIFMFNPLFWKTVPSFFAVFFFTAKFLPVQLLYFKCVHILFLSLRSRTTA